MKHNIIAFAACLMTFLFSSCMPGLVNTPTQKATATPGSIAPPTAEPSPTSTATPITFESMPAKEQAREFLTADGELDTSLLNPEQRKDFSSALVKELNAVRGAYPTTFKDEAYLDYASFRMKNLTDGSSPEQQTFPLFLPVTVDEEGNLVVANTDGSWVTIAGSRGIDWNMIVEEADDPRIDWPLPRPDGEKHCGSPEWFMDPQKDPEERGVQIPVVLLDKKIGQIFLEGTRPSRTRFWGFLRFLTIITDSAGNPVAARNSIATLSRYCLMEEDSDASYSTSRMGSPELLELYLTNPANKDLIAMWEAIETDHAYHLALYMDQEYIITVNSNTDMWQGLAPLKDAYPILAGEKVNDQDLVLVLSSYWIKARD